MQIQFFVKHARILMIDEALPDIFRNRGKWHLFQGNKGQIFKETGEKRQYGGTGNIRKRIFDFGGTVDQANLFLGNKGIVPPGSASRYPLGGPH